MMTGLSAQGSQSDNNYRFYSKMNNLLQADDGEFFTDNDELYVSSLQQCLFEAGFEKPRGIEQRGGTGGATSLFSRILEQMKKFTGTVGDYLSDNLPACFGGTHFSDDH
ncbi:hypothetical protein ABFS82_04G082200 [Erythranthe guttata]